MLSLANIVEAIVADTKLRELVSKASEADLIDKLSKGLGLTPSSAKRMALDVIKGVSEALSFSRNEPYATPQPINFGGQDVLGYMSNKMDPHKRGKMGLMDDVEDSLRTIDTDESPDLDNETGMPFRQPKQFDKPEPAGSGGGLQQDTTMKGQGGETAGSGSPHSAARPLKNKKYNVPPPGTYKIASKSSKREKLKERNRQIKSPDNVQAMELGTDPGPVGTPQVTFIMSRTKWGGSNT